MAHTSPAAAPPLSARKHAEKAAELLAGVEALEQQLDSLTDLQRAELAITGGIQKFNLSIEHTVQRAQAHALTAQALYWTHPVADTAEAPQAEGAERG